MDSNYIRPNAADAASIVAAIRVGDVVGYYYDFNQTKADNYRVIGVNRTSVALQTAGWVRRDFLASRLAVRQID